MGLGRVDCIPTALLPIISKYCVVWVEGASAFAFGGVVAVLGDRRAGAHDVGGKERPLYSRKRISTRAAVGLTLESDLGLFRFPNDVWSHNVSLTSDSCCVRRNIKALVAAHIASSRLESDRARTDFRPTVCRKCADRRKVFHRTSPTRLHLSRYWANQNVWHRKAK
jgi:hypothetical protein